MNILKNSVLFIKSFSSIWFSGMGVIILLDLLDKGINQLATLYGKDGLAYTIATSAALIFVPFIMGLLMNNGKLINDKNDKLDASNQSLKGRM